MPELENAGWEAFAQARARGLNRKNAYIAADYKDNRSGASRLSANPLVAKRLAHLRIEREALSEAGLEKTILALLTLAAGTDVKTAAGVKEARAARLEAHRLNERLADRCAAESYTAPRPMTEAEWEAKYGPAAPGAA